MHRIPACRGATVHLLVVRPTKAACPRYARLRCDLLCTMRARGLQGRGRSIWSNGDPGSCPTCARGLWRPLDYAGQSLAPASPQDSFSALAAIGSLPGKDAPAAFPESWEHMRPATMSSSCGPVSFRSSQPAKADRSAPHTVVALPIAAAMPVASPTIGDEASALE